MNVFTCQQVSKQVPVLLAFVPIISHAMPGVLLLTLKDVLATA